MFYLEWKIHVDFSDQLDNKQWRWGRMTYFRYIFRVRCDTKNNIVNNTILVDTWWQV